MAKIIFTNKDKMPDDTALQSALADAYPFWQTIQEYIHSKYPESEDEWVYPGEQYGWNFRILNKKRIIVYFLPRDRYFKTAFVFNQKAADKIMTSRIRSSIKTEFETAKIYTEGHGIRVDIKHLTIVKSIMMLIDIKMENLEHHKKEEGHHKKD